MNRDRATIIVSATLIGALILGLAGLFFAAFLREAAPINIEADLLQESTALPAEVVHDALVKAGFTSTLYNSSTYDIVVEKVQDSFEPRAIDIGVNARPVDSERFPNVVSLGTIGNIPVLIIARAGVTPITSPAELRGKRIQIGYPGSTSAEIGEHILAQFNVTQGNSSLQSDKRSVAEAMVISGDSDAAIVMYSPYDDSHADFITTPGLQIVPIPAAKAVAGRIGYVVAETLPAGAYRVADAVPAEDITVIGVPITVVARDSVSRSAIFAIARALNTRFGRGSVLSEPGEFPQFLYNIPASDAASEYYDAGIIPWQYRLLPAPVADLVIPIAVTGSVLLILAALYQLLLPEFYTVWKEIIRPRRHHRRQRRGRPQPLPHESK
jgi:hypothetical protein